MATVGAVERRIYLVEGFPVAIRHPDGRNVRGDRMRMPQYRFRRAAADGGNVAAWKTGRFEPIYRLGSTVGRDGRRVHGATLRHAAPRVRLGQVEPMVGRRRMPFEAERLVEASPVGRWRERRDVAAESARLAHARERERPSDSAPACERSHGDGVEEKDRRREVGLRHADGQAVL